MAGEKRHWLETLALWVGGIMLLLVAITGLAIGIVALQEWTNGNDDDAKCRELADLTGGTAIDLNGFGQCRVEFSNGMVVAAADIEGGS